MLVHRETKGETMKGLIFSAPMMLAWLAGKKTVSRRLINPQPYRVNEYAWNFSGVIGGKIMLDADFLKTARYQSGESVYIKETWHCDDPAAAQDIMSRGEGLFYKAGMAEQEASMFKWKSPRFMSEWASRSHALIVSVRPEKIREITEEEAKLEGVNLEDFRSNTEGISGYEYRLDFYRLWNALHPGSWERNEFCWRYELEKGVNNG